jgi:hypothetical protein
MEKQKREMDRVPFLIHNSLELDNYKNFDFNQHCLYYSEKSDKFFQLYAQKNAGSMFIDEFVNQKSTVAIIAPLDPIFFVINLFQQNQLQNNKDMPTKYTDQISRFQEAEDIIRAYNIENKNEKIPPNIIKSKSFRDALERACDSKMGTNNKAYNLSMDKVYTILNKKVIPLLERSLSTTN